MSDFELNAIKWVTEKKQDLFRGVGDYTDQLWIVVTQKKDDPFMYSRYKSSEVAHAFQKYQLLNEKCDKSITIPIQK